jgi:hypothetical protein
MKHRAIGCDSQQGPCFYGIGVSDNCNANTGSFTNLGLAYTNDTGLADTKFFTGSGCFKVKEIEVIEVTESKKR